MTGGAMPYFGDAYMADTRHLSLEEHGAYHLLLLIAWRSPDCALPDDDKRIAQMLGITPRKWAALKPSVMSFWTLTEAGWQQKRQAKERRWVEEKSKQNRAAAKASWAAKSLRNNKPPDANADANAQANADATAYAPPPPKKREVKTKDKSLAKSLLSDGWKPQPFGDGVCARTVAGWDADERERQIETFRSHHQGNGNKWADWQAAWRTWVLNSVKFGRQRPAQQPGTYSWDTLP